MIPQYSEDSTLCRLGTDWQPPACACAHVTRLCRHCGLDVIRSTVGRSSRHKGQWLRIRSRATDSGWVRLVLPPNLLFALPT